MSFVSFMLLIILQDSLTASRFVVECSVTFELVDTDTRSTAEFWAQTLQIDKHFKLKQAQVANTVCSFLSDLLSSILMFIT